MSYIYKPLLVVNKNKEENGFEVLNKISRIGEKFRCIMYGLEDFNEIMNVFVKVNNMFLLKSSMNICAQNNSCIFKIFH